MGAPKAQPRTRLVEARNQRELSQQELAERIGTSYVNVSRWERGITRPGPYFRHRLSQLFGKTEEELDLSSSVQPSANGVTNEHPITSTSEFKTPLTALAATTIVVEPIYDTAMPLPPPVSLVGRDRQLADLEQKLRAGSNGSIIALHGLPGAGKTALASTLAHDPRVRSYFSDGILWAGLGPEPDISSILSHWSKQLGIAATEIPALSDLEAWALTLRRVIGSRRMLLVIDDAWRLEDALAFKVGGPNCAHLVTTRFPGIASSLAPGSATVIKELEENESMELLSRLAPRVVEREPQKARELAQSVGGLPLALTLLGNYLRQQSYSGQSRRVDAALARLSNAQVRLHISELRGPTERHSSLSLNAPLSLQSVIDVTGQQLDPQTRATLYALSVFPPKPNHFSEQAALAVANCDVTTLDTLVDTGLLEISDTGHYTLHQTIADYARSNLRDDTAYNRLITYTTDFVVAHKKDYENLEKEYATILAALELAYASGKEQELMRCVYAFIPYLRSRGLYTLAEKQLQRAYEAATNLGDDGYDGKSHALLYLGEIAQKQGNYEQASAYLRDGLQLARQTGNKERISALLANLGWITWKRGEYSQAETYLREGLTLAELINNSELICDALETLGSVTASRGEYEKSKVYMEQALALARKIGDREKICTLLIDLGVTVGEQGDHAYAEVYFREALELAQRLGHKELICSLFSNLGEVSSEIGNYEHAEAYFQEGLSLARLIDHLEWMSVLLSNLGLLKRQRRYYSQAEDCFREGLTISRRIGNPEMISNILYEYGNLHLDQNSFEAARESFREMLINTPAGSQDLIALAQFGLARTNAALNNINEARDLGYSSVIILENMRHRKALEVRDWLNAINR